MGGAALGRSNTCLQLEERLRVWAGQACMSEAWLRSVGSSGGLELAMASCYIWPS